MGGKVKTVINKWFCLNSHFLLILRVQRNPFKIIIEIENHRTEATK